MRIVFWSTLHGHGTTANMLAVCLTAVFRYQKKSLITQSHYNFNNLEIPLIGKISENDFYRDTGLDTLIRCIKSSKLTKEILDNCSTTVVKEKLSLLIGTRQSNRNIFETDITRVMRKILLECNKYYELVFIDTNSGDSILSKNILDEADIIVANLSQNEMMLDNHFKLYDEALHKKTFYLFGTYDKESRYNMHNLRRRYKRLNNKNSGIIPYNIEFSDSFSDGSLLRYFISNINSDEDNIADDFFYEVHKSTCKILQFANANF